VNWKWSADTLATNGYGLAMWWNLKNRQPGTNAE